jgi:predicted acyltransferase
MFLLLAEALHLCDMADAFPASAIWGFLCHHQSHAAWTGCSLHDLIQPSFTFLVGVALPFSIASRVAKGQSFQVMLQHTLWRTAVLVLLGILLRSIGRSQTYYTFEDTLTQIGMGYAFLFLIGWLSPRIQWSALGALLVGYWLIFALYPLPGADFDWVRAGTTETWSHNATGFAAHWNKNTNAAWAFDTWWLNLFPRERLFESHRGGYSTLSFIPTLGTMILGLIAGGWLRRDDPAKNKTKRFLIAGGTGLAAGFLLDATGICPSVKRIWTPSWTLFSGGWCFLILAGLHWLVDEKKKTRWAFPLLVIGANSIFAYCSEWLFMGFLRDNIESHFGAILTSLFGAPYAGFLLGAGVVAIIWLMLLWLYRRGVFIRI